jgi:hypothetical protein
LTNKPVSKNTQPPLCYKFDLSQIEIGLFTLALSLLGENEDDIMVVDKEKNSRQQRREISLQEALKAISGEQAFQIFRYLTINKTAASLQIAKALNLSRKVFYSNLKDLKNVRIVRKQKGVYSLSILGEIIADSLTMPKRAYRHQFSVEVCEAITSSVLTPNQFKEFVNTTIHDPTIARYVCDWYDRRTDNQIGETRKRKESGINNVPHTTTRPLEVGG